MKTFTLSFFKIRLLQHDYDAIEPLCAKTIKAPICSHNLQLLYMYMYIICKPNGDTYMQVYWNTWRKFVDRFFLSTIYLASMHGGPRGHVCHKADVFHMYIKDNFLLSRDFKWIYFSITIFNRHYHILPYASIQLHSSHLLSLFLGSYSSLPLASCQWKSNVKDV